LGCCIAARELAMNALRIRVEQTRADVYGVFVEGNPYVRALRCRLALVRRCLMELRYWMRLRPNSFVQLAIEMNGSRWRRNPRRVRQWWCAVVRVAKGTGVGGNRLYGRPWAALRNRPRRRSV